MINTWNESLLHEELKQYYSEDSGLTEIPLEGSICDALKSDGTIIEIQTANLGKLRGKLEKLTKNHKVNIVYPVARMTMIETYTPDNELKSRRKSPKKGTVYQVFSELTGLWPLLSNDNLTLSIAYADILEIRVADGTGSWRRKGVRKEDRKLIKLHETQTLSGLSDFAGLIPDSLGNSFTVADLSASGAGAHAGKMAWVLRKCGLLALSGKQGRAYLYSRNYIKSGSDIRILVPSPTREDISTSP